MPSLDQAIALHRAGKLPEAEAAYRAVTDAAPQNADAWSLLGVTLEGQGRYEEAVRAIRHAVKLDPQAGLFRFHLGNALMISGHLAEAAEELRRAANMNPDLGAIAYYNLGNALRQSEDHHGAIAAYRQCVSRAPDAHEARNNLALTLAATGDFDAAFQELRTVIAADPRNIQAQVNLANIADEAGRYEVSYQEALKAVALAPDHASALFVHGLACNRLGRDAEASIIYGKLLARDPENYGAWDNYGQSLQALGQLPEAEAAYNRARALKPEDPDVNYHLALIRLLQGDFAQGFKGYQWRWKAVRDMTRLPLAAPVWDGKDPAGKTILVADEQGFGDSIMFCRYLPLLKARGAKVIYACRPPLWELFKHWDGADSVIPAADAVHAACDAHASMMDLPDYLDAGPDAMPGKIPYLAAPSGDTPPDIAHDKNLRIGIVWAGNKHHKHDAKRSIPFADFAAIFGVPGAHYYNLLRPADLRAGEAAQIAAHDIVDLGAQTGDFADTARFIKALDLVIAVDTATVHLAGALGKPVWVLLPYSPDWRWLTERGDSPWYPTAKLHRQQKPGDWAEVLARVRRDLAMISKKS